MTRKTTFVSLALISILTIAVIFAPIKIVQAGSTVEQIEDISIEWITDETSSKKAIVHVTSSSGDYDFLVEGNVEQVGDEQNVNLDAYLILENGTEVYAASANSSTFDILYGAPYAPSGTGVETTKIHLAPVNAVALAFATIFVIVLMFITIIGLILEATVLSALLDSLQWPIFVASIPWVYLTIFSADHNPDLSLDLYIPMDEYIIPMLLEGMLYIATAFSWWLIAEAQWLIFTYYTATWVQPRLEMPPPPLLPPSASFSWSPDIIGPSQEVNFVSTSYDPDGEIQSWHWWFGDGSEAYGETVTHVYSQTGIYDVRLEVTDNDGLTNEVSTSMMGIILHVIPEAPLGTISLILGMIGALGLFTVIHNSKKVNSKVEQLPLRK